MKILITTTREIPNELYWEWIHLTNAFTYSKIDGDTLLEDGKFKTILVQPGIEKVTTDYKIIDFEDWKE